ncbi:hypothetical protein B0H17DRAFT_1092702 [Mycena rosella]|uniref:Secreted protein n=1 Tax=Mycena rosella TaxID=1033263 RepID=A0AAD7CTZ2_MYCRO|nr:hypothetical protein B0H17DRAFT_1092702 [Mycena rosella]
MQQFVAHLAWVLLHGVPVHGPPDYSSVYDTSGPILQKKKFERSLHLRSRTRRCWPTCPNDLIFPSVHLGLLSGSVSKPILRTIPHSSLSSSSTARFYQKRSRAPVGPDLI